MTECTRRHLSSADAGTLLRRALLTTTSPASQHPELCDAVGLPTRRHTSDDDLAELLEVLEGRLLVGDGPYAAMSAALDAIPVPE